MGARRTGSRGARRPGDREGDERGAAAVEFALLMIPLLMLLFGIIGYGYLLSFRQALSQGASEGARAAAVWASDYSASQQGSRTAAARAQIDDALSSYGVSCSRGATCTISYVPCGTATCVRVSVTYPYASRPLMPTVPFVPMPRTLSYATSARVS